MKTANKLVLYHFKNALNRAEEAELDLVEISPNAEPPVCRIMNYGKFIYEKRKQQKNKRKNKKLFKLKKSNSVRELMMAIIKLNFVALSVS